MLNTSQCKYNKVTKVLSVPHDVIGGGFPDKLEVVSSHTGKVVTFVVDVEAGIAHEFWDGEQCEYVPVGGLKNVSRLVVYNG